MQSKSLLSMGGREHVLVTFSLDTIPDTHKLREERFVLAYCRDFNS